jgi:hypothetical protein
MAAQGRAVRVRFDDGVEIFVRATPLGGEQDVVSIKKALSFSKVTECIESTVRALESTLRKVKPDKATAEFGVELAIESGQLSALIAQGSATASLVISLEWSAARDSAGG